VGTLASASASGATSYASVSPAVLALLEAGVAESRTHVEQMAMDMGRLLETVYPHLAAHAHRVRTLRFLDRMRAVAGLLWADTGWAGVDGAICHLSDTVRGWAAFAVGISDADLGCQLARVRELADDTHFAVREWAWLGLRDSIIAEPMTGLTLLQGWALSSSPRIRRFASEITRPRGVWSRHINALKCEPWMARPLLDALAFDQNAYVIRSVGNWLNDASRTHPNWVRTVCSDWRDLDGSGTSEVRRRACRSFGER
jgi:3-methyladenine DNA glycosylase AlkC